MSIRNVLRRAVRHLSHRLERLHEALVGLGQRLRDSIAGLVGSHLGEAIRDAVRALLAGDILDGAVIRVGYADGELTVGYQNPAYENAA